MVINWKVTIYSPALPSLVTIRKIQRNGICRANPHHAQWAEGSWYLLSCDKTLTNKVWLTFKEGSAALILWEWLCNCLKPLISDNTYGIHLWRAITQQKSMSCKWMDLAQINTMHKFANDVYLKGRSRSGGGDGAIRHRLHTYTTGTLICSF